MGNRCRIIYFPGLQMIPAEARNSDFQNRENTHMRAYSKSRIDKEPRISNCIFT